MNEKTGRAQGPHSSEHATDKNELGFDPDSPDLEDPQVDPQGPAKPPKGGNSGESGKKGEQRR